MNKSLSLLAALLIFSGCASIFVPKRQKVTIVTNQDKSTIYLDKEEFGTGASVTKKVEKDWTKQIIVKTDGYRDRRAVLVPTHRPVGYWVCQVFNLPFDLLFLYPVIWDNMFPKNLAYDQINTISNIVPLVKKRPEDKYIELSKIRLDIKNKNKDISTHYLKYEKDILHAISVYDAVKASEERKAEEKANKKGKKQKKMLNEESDNKLVYDDTKFSVNIFKTLKTTGFIDTVNKVFSDNNNTLILEGKINKVGYYGLYDSRNDGPYVWKTKVNLTWYIKNTYNETLDSTITSDFSDEYIKISGEENFYEKMVADAIESSYLNLHHSEHLSKYMKQQTDFKLGLPSLKLNTPNTTVTEKLNAQEASVIVKTPKGHGSGFVITNDGYVVTNYHVIAGDFPEKTNKITIITSEGQELQGELVRANKFRDLALIKVEKNFARAFKCSNVKSFKNLQDIYTIGAPKSIELGQSISVGVLSNERKINNNNLLQLGMSVNSGNSGGPVFDAAGTLHGVIVSKLVGQNTEGVSFAIPGYLIEEYLNIKF